MRGIRLRRHYEGWNQRRSLLVAFMLAMVPSVPCLSEACLGQDKANGDSLTLKELPTYFYYIIHALREHPGKRTLHATLSTKFDFKNTPPALAYLVLDAMRSAYGDEILEDLANTQSCLCRALPWSYKGGETLPADCEMARDEYIVDDWEWVAACRYAKNGKIRLPFHRHRLITDATWWHSLIE